ncbi:hypothetical protein JAAARDRAFT_30745 [Jaapia argillacea MUCL 33604]|uniref:D-xylose 1-dehydrogenase (NADP(+), D-xylono-1,5-lactone-forming) n=1 Tax=Jaapia argillacea MUCL 33604 TaxID=933084 RepID=A0A067Q2N6_9AGAM|nr:hypothetical protein JAAARDRAFT_30745 [Jaapia argillacea MUCL 33604]
MASLIGLLKRNYKAFNPPIASPSVASKPIKFGILGAARIAPIALIDPCKSHPEAEVYAVAARDQAKAEAFAKKHSIPKVYSGSNGYQALVEDPEVDVVYNPLPNGLHYEWTMKALAAGKHVLLEKPSADTADETRRMFEYAEQKGLVLLEAFHYRFHPAIQRVKAIVESGELGAVKSISASLAVPGGIMKDGDIRYNYALGGGAMMDMGCYTMNAIRFVTGSDPTSVISATSDKYTAPGSTPSSPDSLIDKGTTAHLALPNDVSATLMCSLGLPAWLGILPVLPRVFVKVQCEGGEVDIFNQVGPWVYHSITVKKREGSGRKQRVEKAYTFKESGVDGNGEEWWTTYRYQLEAFVDKLKGRKPQHWITKEDSIANMEWIERVYEKTGLGIRPRYSFVLS